MPSGLTTENEILAMVQHFHHIDADVLEKISPAEMTEILSSNDFKCEEEIIARQVRIWALFGNHSQANNVYNLIRWNCILPSAREQIKHRLPRVWRDAELDVEADRLRPRIDFGHHYLSGGFYDPFYRSRNRSILRTNSEFEVKEVTSMPEFVPGFASPTGMVILDGNIYIVFKTNYDINAKANMAKYMTVTNTWEDLGPVPAIGSFGFCAWKGGLVVIGGKKELSPPRRGNRIRTTSSDHVWFYNVEESLWKQLESLEKPRINPTAAVIDGQLYCLSGLSPSAEDDEMVVNNPDTERLSEITDKWQLCEIRFQPNTHFLKYFEGVVFASHQERNMERLCIGTFDHENDEIQWKQSLKVPAGAQYCFNRKKLFIFGGIITEVAEDQMIPFEILQMSDKILSINLENFDDENVEIDLQLESIPLCNKLSLFCANICNGPIY